MWISRASKPLGALVVLALIVVACFQAQRAEPVVVGPTLGESTAEPPLDPSQPPPDAPDAYDLTVPWRMPTAVAPPPPPITTEVEPGTSVTIPVIVEPTPPPAEWPPSPPPPPVFTPPPDAGY